MNKSRKIDYLSYIYLFNQRLTEINQEKHINVDKYIDKKRYAVNIIIRKIIN